MSSFFLLLLCTWIACTHPFLQRAIIRSAGKGKLRCPIAFSADGQPSSTTLRPHNDEKLSQRISLSRKIPTIDDAVALIKAKKTNNLELSLYIDALLISAQSSVSFSSKKYLQLLYATVESGLVDQASHIAHKLLSNKIRLPNSTLQDLLYLICSHSSRPANAQCISNALILIDLAISAKQQLFIQNFNPLLRSCGTLRNLKIILKRMEACKLEPSQMIFHFAIKSCESYGDIYEALSMIQYMSVLGLSPQDQAFSPVLSLCSKHINFPENIDELSYTEKQQILSSQILLARTALNILREMRFTYCLRPSPQCTFPVLLVLAKTYMWGELKELLEEIEKDEPGIIWGDQLLINLLSNLRYPPPRYLLYEQEKKKQWNRGKVDKPYYRGTGMSIIGDMQEELRPPWVYALFIIKDIALPQLAPRSSSNHVASYQSSAVSEQVFVQAFEIFEQSNQTSLVLQLFYNLSLSYSLLNFPAVYLPYIIRAVRNSDNLPFSIYLIEFVKQYKLQAPNLFNLTSSLAFSKGEYYLSLHSIAECIRTSQGNQPTQLPLSPGQLKSNGFYATFVPYNSRRVIFQVLGRLNSILTRVRLADLIQTISLRYLSLGEKEVVNTEVSEGELWEYLSRGGKGILYSISLQNNIQSNRANTLGGNRFIISLAPLRRDIYFELVNDILTVLEHILAYEKRLYLPLQLHYLAHKICIWNGHFNTSLLLHRHLLGSAQMRHEGSFKIFDFSLTHILLASDDLGEAMRYTGGLIGDLRNTSLTHPMFLERAGGQREEKYSEQVEDDEDREETDSGPLFLGFEDMQSKREMWAERMFNRTVFYLANLLSDYVSLVVNEDVQMEDQNHDAERESESPSSGFEGKSFVSKGWPQTTFILTPPSFSPSLMRQRSAGEVMNEIKGGANTILLSENVSPKNYSFITSYQSQFESSTFISSLQSLLTTYRAYLPPESRIGEDTYVLLKHVYALSASPRQCLELLKMMLEDGIACEDFQLLTIRFLLNASTNEQIITPLAIVNLIQLYQSTSSTPLPSDLQEWLYNFCATHQQYELMLQFLQRQILLKQKVRGIEEKMSSTGGLSINSLFSIIATCAYTNNLQRARQLFAAATPLFLLESEAKEEAEVNQRIGQLLSLYQLLVSHHLYFGDFEGAFELFTCYKHLLLSPSSYSFLSSNTSSFSSLQRILMRNIAITAQKTFRSQPNQLIKRLTKNKISTSLLPFPFPYPQHLLSSQQIFLNPLREDEVGPVGSRGKPKGSGSLEGEVFEKLIHLLKPPEGLSLNPPSVHSLLQQFLFEEGVRKEAARSALVQFCGGVGGKSKGGGQKKGVQLSEDIPPEKLLCRLVLDHLPPGGKRVYKHDLMSLLFTLSYPSVSSPKPSTAYSLYPELSFFHFQSYEYLFNYLQRLNNNNILPNQAKGELLQTLSSDFMKSPFFSLPQGVVTTIPSQGQDIEVTVDLRGLGGSGSTTGLGSMFAEIFITRMIDTIAYEFRKQLAPYLLYPNSSFSSQNEKDPFVRFAQQEAGRFARGMIGDQVRNTLRALQERFDVEGEEDPIEEQKLGTNIMSTKRDWEDRKKGSLSEILKEQTDTLGLDEGEFTKLAKEVYAKRKDPVDKIEIGINALEGPKPKIEYIKQNNQLLSLPPAADDELLYDDTPIKRRLMLLLPRQLISSERLLRILALAIFPPLSLLPSERNLVDILKVIMEAVGVEEIDKDSLATSSPPPSIAPLPLQPLSISELRGGEKETKTGEERAEEDEEESGNNNLANIAPSIQMTFHSKLLATQVVVRMVKGLKRLKLLFDNGQV